ncbi:MAG TPA: hypothetical protein VMW53_06465 [archaeon]|nr:hypothetical protein [archaeon]
MDELFGFFENEGYNCLDKSLQGLYFNLFPETKNNLENAINLYKAAQEI